MKSGKTLLIESSLILIAVLCRPGGLSLLKRRTMAEGRTLQAIKGVLYLDRRESNLQFNQSR